MAALRRRVRVGAKARARIKAGGPTSTHRQALPRAEYRALVAHCLRRERGDCWWCQDRRGQVLDPHHVVKRSQGGPDSADNIVMLCRGCHPATDWPYSVGKLVIRALGGERFVGAMVYAPNKAAGIEKARALLDLAGRALRE